MALAPLWISIRTTGAAALARTSAAFRALAARVRAAAARMAAAGGVGARFTAVLGRLATALRRVAIAALAAARAIGGPLVRALRAAARAAMNMLQSLGMLALRWAALGALGIVALVPLIGIIGNLAGGVMLLAPAIVAVVAAFSAWKLATKGFGDALNADNTEDLYKALAKLSPYAQSAALTLRDLRNEWKSTQQRVQDAFFKGAREDFMMLSRAIQPVADRWLPKLAAAFGRLRTWMSQVFTAAADSGQLDRIMAGVQRFVDGIMTAIPYLTQAFLDIAEVAAPSFGNLGDKIGNAAQRFAEWIRQLKDSGALKAWLDKAKDTFRQLMDVGKEVGRVIAGIFQSSGGGGDFLDNLKKSIKELGDWVKSDNGKEFIEGFAKGGAAIAGLIVWIGKASEKFAEFREWLRSLGDSIKGIFSSIGSAATGMFGILAGGAAAFGWISGVVGRLGGLVAAVQGAARMINAALASIRTSVFIDIITRRFDSGSKGYAKGIGSSGGGGGLKYYAKGGRVRAGEPIVVGDGGRPELFVPDSAGRIEPRVPSSTRHMPYGGMGGVLKVEAASGHAGNWLVQGFLAALHSGQLRIKAGSAGRIVPA